MKDQLTLFPINVHRTPDGVQELLQFAHFMLHNNPATVFTDEHGQQSLNPSYFIFSPLYREAMDVMFPNFKTPEDKAIWSDCFSALVQRMEASGTVVLLHADLPGSAAGRVAAVLIESVLVLAETSSGERGALRYTVHREKSGKMQLVDGAQFRPEHLQVNFMGNLFGRRGHSSRALRYAEQMLERYPPTAGRRH